MTMGNPQKGLNIKALKSAPEPDNHSDQELNNVIGMIEKDSVDDSNQLNDFDEKMDQNSYIE